MPGAAGCPRDDDPPRCAGTPCICDIGATNVKEEVGQVLIGRARSGRAKLGEPVPRDRWASRTHWVNLYSLGEPVLIGQVLIGQAIPSNKVWQASTKGPLGEPYSLGKTRTYWASHLHRPQRRACLALCQPKCPAMCLLGTST